MSWDANGSPIEENSKSNLKLKFLDFLQTLDSHELVEFLQRFEITAEKYQRIQGWFNE